MRSARRIAGGGAVTVEMVDKIPLQHQGVENPVANDTQIARPQQPAKVDREKEEVIPPDAIPLKSRSKKTLAHVASQSHFQHFEDLDHNQVFAKDAPQLVNKMFQRRRRRPDRGGA